MVVSPRYSDYPGVHDSGVRVRPALPLSPPPSSPS